MGLSVCECQIIDIAEQCGTPMLPENYRGKPTLSMHGPTPMTIPLYYCIVLYKNVTNYLVLL